MMSLERSTFIAARWYAKFSPRVDEIDHAPDLSQAMRALGNDGPPLLASWAATYDRVIWMRHLVAHGSRAFTPDGRIILGTSRQAEKLGDWVSQQQVVHGRFSKDWETSDELIEWLPDEDGRWQAYADVEVLTAWCKLLEKANMELMGLMRERRDELPEPFWWEPAP